MTKKEWLKITADTIQNQQIVEQMDTLYGKITKYIGRYNDNYCIVAIKAPDKNHTSGYKSVTCMGVIGDIPLGTMCEFSGSFGLNKKGIKVYKFNSYQIMDPDTTSDIIQYLSDQIDGIDSVIAKKICNKFKKETIKILDSKPEKLLTIKGIGKNKVDAIINSWQKHRETMDVHIQLQKVGISLSIIESLKRNAKEKNQSIKEYIIENSYELIYLNEDDDFLPNNSNNDDNEEEENNNRKRTLSFDEIELIYKIVAPNEYENNKFNYKRIEAAIYTFLKDKNFESGNVCQYYYFTIFGAAKILNLDSSIVSQIVANEYAEENNHIKVESIFSNNDPNKCVIYTKKDYINEKNLANSLISLYYSNLSLIDYDKNKIDQKYNEDQKNAIIKALQNPVTIITGGPGTGKTTIINELVNICEYRNYKKVLLLAPTAKAAKKINEATGHSAGTVHSVIYCRKEELYNSDVIIVDEASMLDNTVASKLVSMLESHQKLILVGDIDQLPSVDIGNVLKDVINSQIFPVIKLNQIYRQKYGNDIISAAKDINNGNVPNLNNSIDIGFIDININNVDQFVLLKQILNEIKGHLYDENDLIKEVQILSPVKKNDSGTYKINQFVQQYLYDKNLEDYKLWRNSIEKNAKDQDITDIKYRFDIRKGVTIFNVGDRVINTKNNYDKEVFNGEVGIIKQIVYDASDKELKKVRRNESLDSPSLINKYKVLVHFTGHYESDLIEFNYNDLDSLQLAYAMTVHKSQGSEYEYVILFLNSQHYIMLQRNLLYTAVTRAKNKLFIIGDQNAINRAVYNINSNKRLTFLKERLLNNIKEVKH